MFVIAVANEKGGVAKTTTTLSLGSVLAAKGYKTCIVDLDAQANLSLAIGFDPNQTQKSVAGLFQNTSTFYETIQQTKIQNLWLVPSNHQMSMSERFLPIQRNYEYLLRDIIRKYFQDFDYVVIDCPPFLGAVTLNALVAANLLLIPTQAEYFSVFALKGLMAWIKQIRSKHNAQLTYRLVLTMVDKRNKIHRVLSEQLRNSFNNGLFETTINIDTKLRECPIAGLPIIHHAGKSRAALQYTALGEEIVNYVTETN
ncbi:MAG: ParA family protein [Anaerolineaceae bacterium]|nr:ParA family protein [Anaerolineaceae bacterium]